MNITIMTKKYLFVFIAFMPLMAMAQQKLAVVVVPGSLDVDESTKQIVATELASAIAKTNKYEVFEMTELFFKQLRVEQNFQRITKVENNQVSSVGKYLDVNYVCVTNLIYFNEDKYYIQAKLVDVESAAVLNIAQELTSLKNFDEIPIASDKVAEKLLAEQGSNANITAELEDTTTMMTYNSHSERHHMKVKKFSFGDLQMNGKNYALFLSNNCQPAFKQYVKGKKMIASGWSLCGLGVVCVVSGIALNSISDLSIPVAVTGAAMLVSSAALLPIGYVYCKQKSVDTFNSNCARNTKIACSFNLQSSRNGIGLSLSF